MTKKTKKPTDAQRIAALETDLAALRDTLVKYSEAESAFDKAVVHDLRCLQDAARALLQHADTHRHPLVFNTFR